jgi:polyhydroxybutyrate depolymerase
LENHIRLLFLLGLNILSASIVGCESNHQSSPPSLTQMGSDMYENVDEGEQPDAAQETLDADMHIVTPDMNESDALITIPDPPETLGGDRPAPYILPNEYDPQTPAPLVILLHGFSGTARTQNLYFRLSAETQKSGAILILPDGRVNPDGNQFWSATDYCCDFYRQGDVDVSYLLGLIDEAQTYFQIDPSRIALVGHSNGGFMSYRLACDASDVITHIVSLAGATWANAEDCAQTQPVSVLQIHGSLDLTIRYQGHQPTAGDPDTTWDMQACWNMNCSEPRATCAASAECGGIWECMNACGWEARDTRCRDECYDNGPEAAQLLWTEELSCALNAGCTDDPAEPNAGYTSAEESVRRWTERNGCMSQPVMLDRLDLDLSIPDAETRRLAWTSCDRSTVTGLWTIEQGGHIPPMRSTFSEQVVQWILDHKRTPRVGD